MRSGRRCRRGTVSFHRKRSQQSQCHSNLTPEASMKPAVYADKLFLRAMTVDVGDKVSRLP